MLFRSAPLSYLHPSAAFPRPAPAPAPSRPAEADPDLVRVRKRQRVDSRTSSPSTSRTSIEPSLIPSDSPAARPAPIADYFAMRLTDSDRDSALSVSLDSHLEAGPSSAAVGPSNGHKIVAKSNGFSLPHTNGSSNGSILDGLDGYPQERQRSAVARVSLPGRTLYDDSYVDREEFVRLVIQSLRDVGYM